jgi:1-acyl-sn-glycerol-3-phosphate acyltransferase
MKNVYRRKPVKTPPAGLYIPCRWLARFFCRFGLGLRVTYAEKPPKTGPLVVLGAHEGMMDALFMAASVRNRRLNFVTTERFFRARGLGVLFRALQVIPRIQFHPDPRSIHSMLRVAKQGGAIGLFPAGQTSMCGVPGVMPPSIARLLKKLNATVFTLTASGSFFTKSRFRHGMFLRGRVEARVAPLFTPEALAAASEEAVYAAVCAALSYNAFAWQAKSHVRWRGPDRARGYESVLTHCPACGAAYHMRSHGHRIFCADCGNGAVVGPDMAMTADPPGSVIFDNLLAWYKDSEKRLIARIDDLDAPFELKTPATAQLYRGTVRETAGTGVLRLDRAGIYFDGELDGKPVALSIAHAHLPGMAAETGAYMEIYDKDYGPVRYLPENPLCVTDWKIAQEYLYAQSQNLN